MSIGELRNRIILQKLSDNPDAPGWSSGSQSEAWEVVASVWARIDHLKGDEQFAAGSVFENVMVQIKVRRLAVSIDATKPYRFVLDGGLYKIKEIDSTTARGYTIFTCEKMEQ